MAGEQMASGALFLCARGPKKHGGRRDNSTRWEAGRTRQVAMVFWTRPRVELGWTGLGEGEKKRLEVGGRGWGRGERCFRSLLAISRWKPGSL